MDRDEAIRRAEIAMAWARGEAVQFFTGQQWRDLNATPEGPDHVPHPDFFHPDQIWRVKPAPARCWMWRYESGRFGTLVEFSDEKPTKRYHDGPAASPGDWIPMIEDTDR